MQRILPFVYRFRKERLPFSLYMTALLSKLLSQDMKRQLLNWEPELKEKFRVQKGWTVLDVGANIGQWSVWLSEEVGENGMVIALEPDSGSFGWLRRNLRGRKNVRTVKVAAWSENGWVGFEPTHDFYHSRISSTSHFRVPTITIDSLVEKLGIGVANAIKVDVEGAEANVLRGARKTLEKMKLVLVEIHDEGYSCAKILVSLGFSVDKIDGRHLLGKKI